MMHRNENKAKDWSAYVRSVFLRYIDEHPSSAQNAYFPPFFQRELDLSDCYSYLHRMQRQGYLKKNESGCLVLTGKGRETMREDHLRLFDLADPYVSVSEFMEERKRHDDGDSFDQTMLAMLLKKIPLMKEEDDFSAVKIIHLDVARLYEEMGVCDRAVYHYLTALYYDVSGLNCYDKLVQYVHGKCKRSDAKDAFRGLVVCPEVMDGLRRLRDSFDPGMVGEIFQREQISINMLTQQSFTELARALCDGTYDYNTWQTRGETAYGKMLAQAERLRKEK
ncbi:MAG: hypothetical protein II458_08400 [Oscillospiraceae bacterium]|nr:hypothetical protein [Oscillospiraceae bacterium]